MSAPFQTISSGTLSSIKSIARALHIAIMSTSPSRMSCCDCDPLRHHMRLDFAHLAEGAVDIHGVELVGRHAIGQQREGEATERAVVEATAAGELLDVPEVGPALRPAVRKLVLAVDQIGAERIAGDAVVAHHVSEHS